MRKKDGLEDFIWKNKEQMDRHIPKGDLWRKIESDLENTGPDEPQKSPGEKWKWIALSLLALLATAYTFYQMGSKENVNKTMLFAEVESMEHYYNRETQKLMNNAKYASDMLLMPDIEDIDTHIAEIKEELGDLPTGSEEKALGALLESYKTKMMILQKVIKQYEISQPKNNNDEFNI